MVKKAVSLCLAAVLLGGCAPKPVASAFLNQVPLNSTTKQVTIPSDIKTSVYELAAELTPDYFKESKRANQIFSPLSLWYALGVLREGAVGETLEELNSMMKVKSDFSSAKVIPELSATLNFMEESRLVKEKTKSGIRLTNGIFFDQRYAANIKEAYWKKTASVWGAETAKVDFTKKAETQKLIQDWVSEKTDQFVKDYEAAFETDGTAILNIYNVLYLKDQWLTAFDKQGNQVFHTPQGDVSAAFVGRVADNAWYVDHPKAEAAAFEGEKGIRVWFLLPKDGLQPVELVGDLPAILSAGDPKTLDFKAPVLDIDGDNTSLKKLLQAKGYNKLFTSADLDNMLTGVSAVVTEIKQKTKLQMDENGFKAAAITEIGVGKTSLPSEPLKFTVDRPYLLVIEYQSLPLFIAQITNPAEKPGAQ